MARHPRGVDEAIARFDDLVARFEGRDPAARAATRRNIGRTARSVGRRVANIGMALAVLIVATVAFGLIVSPIGWTGLFVISALTLAILLFFTVGPVAEKKETPFTDDLPNAAVVQRLDGYLVRRRAALPAPAARRVDAISQQLPLLESRLGQADILDPLAQDARRLMGKHLPELIERYERVPAQYRSERDAEGLTVDERLVQGLDAAKTALDDLGRKLAHEDLAAFETQGRFIESRYKEEDQGLKGG